MKNLCLTLLALAGLSAHSQYKSEVKFNIANIITIASVEVGYEYFLDDNQSLGAEIHFNDRFSYYKETATEKFNTTSILVNYNYYFNPEEPASFYAFPFLKYRFGSYKYDDPLKENIDMNSFIIGLGIGYKWAWNDKFTLAPYASIARNFSSKISDEFTSIEANGGISIGYRF